MQEATTALGVDESPEYLEALLVALANGRASAPHALLQFAADPRVRPALVEATARAAAEDLSNFASVVGRLGGPGACEVLRSRMRDLADDPKTYDDDPFNNRRAFSLTTVAAALLALDADATDAAHILVRLMDHPCARNRGWAVYQASESVRRWQPPSTEASSVILDAVAARFEADPDSLHTSALPVLLARQRNPRSGSASGVQAYLDRLLSDPEPRTRRSALQALVVSGDWWLVMQAFRALVRWATEYSDVDTILPCAHHLGSLVPSRTIERVVVEGLADESPGVREHVMPLLDHLSRNKAQRLAADALRDEPDPALRRTLEAHLQSRRRSKRAST